MTVFLSFTGTLAVLLLMLCTCTYLHTIAPSLLDAHKKGFQGIFWKMARIGERLSPYVSIACISMSFYILFIA